MDIDKIERIKRKVAKLMALAMGTTNKHEAKNAMIKAARFMAKYHVSENDLDGKIISVEKCFTNGRVQAKSVEHSLFDGICESMGVFGLYASYTRATSFRRARPCIFTLTGNETDILIAWYMFETCLNQIKIEAKKYRAQGGINIKAVNDYEAGLCLGVIARFSTMAKTDIQVAGGFGLVTVDARHYEAEQWYKDSGKTFSMSNTNVRNTSHLTQGRNDSGNIRVNAGINGGRNCGKTMRLR